MGWTLQECMSSFAENPNKKLFSRDISKNMLLQYLLQGNLNHFIEDDTGDCNFTGEEFKKMLEFVNIYSMKERDNFAYN